VTPIEIYFVPLQRLLILKHSDPVFVIGLGIIIIIIIIDGVIVLFVMCLSVSSIYFEMVCCFLV
jgi:hypothetical protein